MPDPMIVSVDFRNLQDVAMRVFRAQQTSWEERVQKQTGFSLQAFRTTAMTERGVLTFDFQPRPGTPFVAVRVQLGQDQEFPEFFLPVSSFAP